MPPGISWILLSGESHHECTQVRARLPGIWIDQLADRVEQTRSIDRPVEAITRRHSPNHLTSPRLRACEVNGQLLGGRTTTLFSQFRRKRGANHEVALPDESLQFRWLEHPTIVIHPCHTELMEEGLARHPWEDWVWDETVFEGTAAYYRQGRKPYAPALAGALAEHLHLDGRGRLLDIGCGPGTVALYFAHLFEDVVGLDPDPGMVAEAQRAAAEERISNASWLQRRAEELPGPLGTFRVISFGQSFHWMDRPRVATSVRKMLEGNGAVVQVELWHSSPPGQVPPSGRYPPIPEATIDELRRRWLGPDRRAGQGFRNTSPDGEDAVFQAAGFAPEELVIVPDDRVLERSVDDVVAWVLSTSSTAPHLFGDHLDDFVLDLRGLLLEVSPEGRFSVALSDNRLRIRRPR